MDRILRSGGAVLSSSRVDAEPSAILLMLHMHENLHLLTFLISRVRRIRVRKDVGVLT